MLFRFTIANHAIEIESEGEYIIGLRFIDNVRRSGFNIIDNDEFKIALTARRQIDEYLKGQRKTFRLPIILNGTDFQKKVWRELQKVKYGETISYSRLATKIGRPTSVRAVANAVGKNPIGIIIPCHRVIAKAGKPGGFSWGVELKRNLLKIEGVEI